MQTADAITSGTFNNLSTRPFARSVTTGNMIVCVIRSAEGVFATKVTDLLGNNFKKAGSVRGTVGTESNQTLEAWYLENVVGGNNNVVTANWATAITTSFTAFGCFEYSGIKKTASLINSQIVSLPSNNGRANMGPLTSVAGSNLAFHAVCGNQVPVADPNYTRRSSLADDLYEDRIGGAGSYSVSASIGVEWSGVFLLFSGF